MSLKPGTVAEEIFPYLELIDMVLVMTVEPGFGGQKFMHDMMKKVTAIKEKITQLDLSVDIQVDGGINEETLKISKKAGADIFVLGTAFFKSPCIPNAAELLDE